MVHTSPATCTFRYIDAYREQLSRYDPPSRAQVIYEALEALWEQEDFEPSDTG